MPSSSQAWRQARFLVVEGLDGTGTTTVARLVAEALQGRDLRVCLTAEPTDGRLGRVLRTHLTHEVTLDPWTTALLFSADRADHLARTIRPALVRGDWVVCDRYLLSTLAYQGAEGVSQEAVLAASGRFEVPDLTIVLDVSDVVRMERMVGRGRVERYEDPELAGALRTSYEAAISLLIAAGHRVEMVDASADAPAVTAEILRRLDTL